MSAGRKDLVSSNPGGLVLQKVLANELVYNRWSCLLGWVRTDQFLKVPKT